MNAGDITTVMTKEMRELGDAMSGGSRSQLVLTLFLGVFFGVVSPLRHGADWFGNPAAVGFYAFLGMVLVMQPIADVFAGERERHTLETLLSTRLDDSSILMGKLLGVLAPVWIASALLYGVAIVATNVVHRDSGLHLPSATAAAGTLALIVLAPGLTGSIGIFVSLRAPTVRKAAQTISLVTMALVFLPLIASQALPHEWLARLDDWLRNATPQRVLLTAGGVLLLVELSLIVGALGRFKRGRLTLD